MNQYRCENCKHYESGSQWCYYLGERISNLESVLIERVGYASHGSKQSGHDKTRYNCKAYGRIEGRDCCEVIGSVLIPGFCPCSAWQSKDGEPND